MCKKASPITLALLKTLVMSHPPIPAKINHTAEPKTRCRKLLPPREMKRLPGCMAKGWIQGCMKNWRQLFNPLVSIGEQGENMLYRGELVWANLDGATTICTPSHSYPVSLPFIIIELLAWHVTLFLS